MIKKITLYKISQLEFRCIAIILHAKKIPELAISIGKLNNNEFNQAIEMLKKRGLIITVGDEYTYHLKEDLILSMLNVIDPEYIVLVRNIENKTSILFYVQGKQITGIGLSKNDVFIEVISGIKKISEQALSFLRKTSFGLIAILEIKNNIVATTKHIELKKNSIYLSSKDKVPLSIRTVQKFITDNIPTQVSELDKTPHHID